MLQPPSAPDSEEEDNNGGTVGTAETELEREENVMKHGEFEDEDDEDKTAEEPEDFCLKQSKLDKESVLISIEDDINLPPQPEVPALFNDDDDEENDDEFPAPPPCGADLITFSESEDQRERSELENELFTVQPESAVDLKQKTNISPGIECTCESLQPLHAIDPLQDRKPSNNSLFFDTEDSAEVGRPAPIVLTRNRNGPIKAAVAVKRSNSASGSRSSSSSSGSSRSPLPQSVSVDFSRERSTPSLSTRQHSLPEASSRARPYSSTDVITVEHPPKFLKKTRDPRPRVISDSEPEPFTQASDPLIPEPPKEEKNLNRFSRDSNDFPPPPPSIEDNSTLDQGDSPWVPLMSRFQVDAGVTSVSESDEPLLPQRRPRPKTSTGANEQKVPKFRSYTPKPKPTYVEVKNSEEQNQKSETCVWKITAAFHGLWQYKVHFMHVSWMCAYVRRFPSSLMPVDAWLVSFSSPERSQDREWTVVIPFPFLY